ncbi:transferrin-like [Centruroides vittatus]|uniref:transferrin-like n=1 Tax=Centruroides vittatus TaxID=120091 RepID=UPI00350EB082
MKLTLITSLFFLIGLAQCHAQKLKFCSTEKSLPFCLKMAEEHSDLVECVSRIDVLSCLDAIAAREADIMNLDAANIFVAGNSFNLSVLAFEQNNGEPYKYRSVALVPKSMELSSLNDLEGKKSCHTGVGRTAGWQIPIAELSSRGILEYLCSGDIATAAAFFNQSCAPGKWSNDPIVDAELKKQHPNLCSLCENPKLCSKSDRYSGYEGALRCLHDDRGDIAFSKTEVVEKYVQDNPDFAEKYEYLCIDNTRKSLSDGADIHCSWGVRPSNAFVICSHKTTEERDHYYSILRQLYSQYSSNIPQIQNQQRPEWFTKFFVSSVNVSDILRTTPENEDPLTYLGKFTNTMDRRHGGCQPLPIRFCTTSEEGINKCRDLDKVVRSRRIYVKIECILEASTADCITAVKEDRAHLITLDGGDVYRAGKYSNLIPIASELYGKLDEGATYYAVAVIPSNSEINELEDLRGLESCHTGIGRTAGWVMPVGFLTSKGLISKSQCDKAAAIAAFFSASCVPGANNPKYNPSGSGADKLCQQCIGDVNGENKCARGSTERYSGYSGALRCLAENGGQIAFVKHTTVSEYTDGSSELEWAKELKSENFKLLCKNGSTDSVENYKDCNLGRVPSHNVMISADYHEMRLWFTDLITSLDKWFGSSSNNFNLFKPYGGKADLLFKDSTKALRAVPLSSTYKDVLGEDYVNAVESTDPTLCVEDS